ncbi:MAG: hypothetical protein HW389_3528 [Bacteroidetes bacterium]|nr:hypothetical protein [Bacteroidota bacterium]
MFAILGEISKCQDAVSVILFALLENVVIDGAKFHQFSGIRVRSVNVSGPKVTFQRNIESPDFFVLCLSSEFSQAVMAEFADVDTCLEIINVRAFFQEITDTLNAASPVSFRGFRECHYSERVEKWNERDFGTHPALMKEPDFEMQKEARAIWHPLSPGSIHPITIRSPNLIGLCKDVTHEMN